MADFRVEHPDFPAADMPAIPAGFEDTSWHNNSCPNFASDAAGLEIWIDYLDPAQREHQGPRFHVSSIRDGIEVTGPWFQSDNWDEVLAFIASNRFD